MACNDRTKIIDDRENAYFSGEKLDHENLVSAKPFVSFNNAFEHHHKIFRIYFCQENNHLPSGHEIFVQEILIRFKRMCLFINSSITIVHVSY